MRRSKALHYGAKKKPDYVRKQSYRFSRRALLVGGAQAGLFGLLGWRLHQLQIKEASDYRLLSDENRLMIQLAAPSRGSIRDRTGAILAEDKENLRLLVVPAFSKNLPETLDRLSRIVDIPRGARDRVMRAAARQSGYYPVLVAEGLTWRQFALLNVLAPQIPGMQTDRSSYRKYHHARPMAHLVGYVGMAGKEEVDLDPVMRLPGFRAGRAGVEKTFDEQLRGTPGTLKFEVDSRGRVVRELGSTPSTPGKDLVLSIDHHLQAVAQERLKEHRVASIVVLDVETGGILALASTPTFDPNEVVFKVDPKAWGRIARAKDQPLQNRAIRGQYPPGSTFKVVTALAGLHAGVINPRETMSCPGVYRLGRARFRCWRAHGGGINLHEAIKQSCDVYFYETAKRMGIDHLAAVARHLGMGRVYDCGLPGQKEGIIPDVAWKRAHLMEPWYGGETVIAGIGQGFVSSTPLQLAVMAARVATGRAVLPKLVLTPDDPEPDWPALQLDPSHLAAVRSGMFGVVNEPRGTARRSALKIPDVQMAGKTGTSQVVNAYNEHKLSPYERETHALFIAYAPADKPRYAAACVVEHGGGGSSAAAPIVKDVMTEALLRDSAKAPAFVGLSRDEVARQVAVAGDDG
ncbi:penicillin-binding protein 2 [Methyloceanibacter caenitepidi]|uniref:Beta-lactamase n=1 Tax=Methyloceanibacter caenitepidi TaxID=1384459 RepID=A0A0A8K284_9HYPH|nr:penicillin-binding protein 2 [Methyloceanibacter caenitepidi]BAQ17078.1 penicillin-binding protein 2 [Methyloceanibacter caenitepidi]